MTDQVYDQKFKTKQDNIVLKIETLEPLSKVVQGVNNV